MTPQEKAKYLLELLYFYGNEEKYGEVIANLKAKENALIWAEANATELNDLTPEPPAYWVDVISEIEKL